MGHEQIGQPRWVLAQEEQEGQEEEAGMKGVGGKTKRAVRGMGWGYWSFSRTKRTGWQEKGEETHEQMGLVRGRHVKRERGERESEERKKEGRERQSLKSRSGWDRHIGSR